MRKSGHSKALPFIGNTCFQMETPLITISVVNYSKYISDHWHFHDKKHVLAVLTGGNTEHRKTTTELKAGSTTSYREGEKHRNSNVSPISKNIIIEFNEKFFDSEMCYDNLEFGFHTFSTLVKTYQECSSTDLDNLENIYQSLYSLFGKNPSKHFPAWLTTLRDLLNDRWNEFISLHELSQELNLHPVTISKYFSKYFGCTLAEYMRKIKVERATQLLFSSTLKKSEIAYLCGFSDQSHMSRLIKRHYGLSPKGLTNYLIAFG